MEERIYQTRCGTIHYWVSVSNLDTITLVFLPGLTADHRLFDKQAQYFERRYNVIVWDAPAHGSSRQRRAVERPSSSASTSLSPHMEMRYI